jgi:hypothetical protein
VAIGRFNKGLRLVDEAIRLVEANGDLVHIPEALRVNGDLRLSMPQRRHHEAETCFIQSLDWNRRQSARSWELRAAADLAAVWARSWTTGTRPRVSQLIFKERARGLDTADLKAAEHPLATLR